MGNVTATAEIEISAPTSKVWAALTDPELIARYFFGSRVETDWQPGHPIVWRGEYEGTAYEDKGRVLEVDPNRLLKVTHFSPMTGLPDIPENYHTVSYELHEHGSATRVVLTQDNNADEAAAERATKNWEMMLSGLKRTVEEG